MGLILKGDIQRLLKGAMESYDIVTSDTNF